MTSKMSTMRIGAAATAALGLAVLLPSVGASTAFAEDTTGTACVVTGGEMQWGVKESFRSYISSSIANGEWQASDGASYETPTFTFSNAHGEVDSATGTGSIAFNGTVVFTGHDGVLNLTLANPSIEFLGDGTARLHIDAKSNDAEGKLTIDDTQVNFGKIEAVGDLQPASGTIEFTDAITLLTADGAAAFSGFYSSGEALDPITMTAQFGECAAPAPATDTEVGPGQDDTSGTGAPGTGAPGAAADTAAFPWLPVSLGGAAVVVIAVATGFLIAGRKRPAAGGSVAQGNDEPSA